MMFLWPTLAIALAILGVAAYRIMMSPELKYHSIWYKMKAGLVFWIGDVRRLNKFPWVTWATHGHKISYKESREGAVACRPGDIGLHRDEGFLSNLGIPGAFKHAWIVVDNNDCVEALSEGVVRRDCIAPLISDYAIILRPLNVVKADVDQAIRRAKSIVGSDYDANFNFNFEETDANMGDFTRNLDAGKFHAAFSCTETVGFSWYHCRKKLEIFRSEHAGREAIIADDYLKMKFEIVWLSSSITNEWALKNGLHEEGRQKIKDFLAGKRSFNRFGNPIPKR